MDDEKANDTSDILIEADMMGHSTHGVRLLPLYIKDIEMGNMKISGKEDVLKDFGSSITLDGKQLPGIWLTKKSLKAFLLGIFHVYFANPSCFGCLFRMDNRQCPRTDTCKTNEAI